MLFLTFLLFIKPSSCALSSSTVYLPLGTVEGYQTQSLTGKTFFAFEGVPYASPPVNGRRFKDPIPPKPWRGIWKAQTMFKCMQYDHYSPEGQNRVIGDEDCLYINIYTPDLNPLIKFDVLVFIHGGAFMFNYGGKYEPHIIIDRQIVYVNFNYRLGPLGFLSTEDDVVPGNMGLKDQSLALKWIKENIQYFGGDPNSITISGMSAGGASVEFHYLSPKSRGLFKGGISQSGTSLNAWVLMENPLEKTKKLSSTVGCPTADTEEMITCLKEKPARQITHAVKHFLPWLYNPFSPFGVVVDTWASTPFLPDHPYNLLKDGKVEDVPWITSYVSSEGLYPASEFYLDLHLDYLDKHWDQIIPHILHYNETVNPTSINSVSQKIRKEYLGDKKLTKDTFMEFLQSLSDRLFKADIEKAGKLHSAAVNSQIYSYYFEYRGAHSSSELRTESDVNLGVSHADDTYYVLKCDIDTLSTVDDRKMSAIMVDMFVSFMETGRPNITSDWKPLSKNPNDPWVQLNIKSPSRMIMEVKDELGNRKFWDSLPFEENDSLFKIKYKNEL